MAATDPSPADERERLAGAAWAQVARLFLSQQDRRSEIAAELGVGAGDLIALFHVPDGEGVAQRDLATHWDCDPSWVTTRVDRLEELGLVERRAGAPDRRVKEVWLTKAGRTLRARGMAEFNRPPDRLLELSTTDLRALARVLGHLDLPDPTDIRARARDLKAQAQEMRDQALELRDHGRELRARAQERARAARGRAR